MKAEREWIWLEKKQIHDQDGEGQANKGTRSC